MPIDTLTAQAPASQPASASSRAGQGRLPGHGAQPGGAPAARAAPAAPGLTVAVGSTAANCCGHCGATSYRRDLARDARGALRPTARLRCSGCDRLFDDARAWRGAAPDPR